MNEIEMLETACRNTGRLIDGVADDQWHAATPCTEWDVRQLVNHTTWTVQLFAAAAKGEPPANPPDADVLGDDPSAAFHDAAVSAVEAWRAMPSLDQEIQLGDNAMPAQRAISINLLDTYVHGWDIARATGQEPHLDDTISQAVLDASHQVVTDEVRAGGGFAAAVATSSAAPTPDQMVGFLGRQP